MNAITNAVAKLGLSAAVIFALVGLALGIEPGPATQRLLLAREALPEVVVSGRENLDVLTSDDTLADVRDWLAVRSARDARTALRALSHALKGHIDVYDFVIVDCGPGLNILTLNALMLSDSVLVPVSVDYLSAAGTQQHLETLEGLREVSGKAELRYVVPTFFDSRLNRAREILEILKQTFGPLVTDPIRTNTRLAEAPHQGQSIFEYDPRALGAEDYEQLVQRILYDYQA